ncbi:MAG: alpha/beta hydrolase [Aquabacterium sp.]
MDAPVPAAWRGALRRAAGPLLAAVLAYGLICAAMWAGQRQLQYRPDPTPVAPQNLGLQGAEVLTLPTADGERIVAWWLAPASARAPVYLYLHGNGGQLGSRARRFALLTAGGAGVLAISWRGYGGSSGSPSEAGLLADARAGLAEVRRRAPQAPLVIFGESLGTAVAVLLAAEQQATGTSAPQAMPPAALVLDSALDSALAVARQAYPWLPVALLLRDTYRADLAALRVTVPVLQVHCKGDSVTPLAQAQALNARLGGARPLHLVDGDCHIAPLARWQPVLEAFIAEVLQPTRVAGGRS